MMQSGSYILGPILGAAMYAAFPINAILLTDLMGAIVACCLLGVVKVPKLIAKNKVKQSFKDDFKEGLSVYAADRKLLVIIIAETLCLIFYMPLTTFFPLMISSYFNAGA
ncbi:MAG: MFS transporter, partial [Eubacterium sp.]